ncbi:MAG: hypothetical protein Q8O92_00120 [Candidatus Latescibacter sp.]|nr:hypothetical protein [Candidatus Latescibacter sp.]
MKTVPVAFVLFALAFGMSEARGENGLGVGVIVGEPTGVSIKKWIGGTRAVDAAAAWSFSENKSFQFHADYLYHNFSLLRSKDFNGRLPVYYGVGGRIKLKDTGQNDENALIGIRIPFGISYLFADAPVDLFAEVVPILDVTPDTDLDINAAIGVRFYFR